MRRSVLCHKSDKAVCACSLVGKATVLTPNLAEAAALTGSGEITTLEGMKEAARKLHARGAANVLVKGGHLPDEPNAGSRGLITRPCTAGGISWTVLYGCAWTGKPRANVGGQSRCAPPARSCAASGWQEWLAGMAVNAQQSVLDEMQTRAHAASIHPGTAGREQPRAGLLLTLQILPNQTAGWQRLSSVACTSKACTEQLAPDASHPRLHAAGEEDQARDVFFDGQEAHVLTGPKIATRNTHGTGCTLASAIAAHLALGLQPLQAVQASKAWLGTALAASSALRIGQGDHGPLNHG